MVELLVCGGFLFGEIVLFRRGKQEGSHAFEGTRPDAFDSQQIRMVMKESALASILNDPFGQCFADAGQQCPFGPIGAIDVQAEGHFDWRGGLDVDQPAAQSASIDPGREDGCDRNRRDDGQRRLVGGAKPPTLWSDAVVWSVGHGGCLFAGRRDIMQS